MGIKFSCTNCGSVLNVKDEYAGKSAKCPKCQTVLKIPAASEPDPLGNADLSAPLPGPVPLNEPSFEAPASNPYSAPNTRATGPTGSRSAAGVGHPTAADVGNVLSHAMKVWQNNLGILVGVTAIFFAILFVFGFVSEILNEVLIAAVNEPLFVIPVILTINVIQYLLQWYLTMGMTKVALSVSRGRPASVGMLFDGEYYLPYVLACFVGTLALVFGLVLLVIPGIILGLYFWPYATFIADGKAGTFDSFSKAAEIAKLNMGTTIVLALASVGIMLVGFLALCVGILFAAPLVSVIWATAYLMMRGEIR
jgi:hypothetical protein